MNYQDIAQTILENVGGKENISSVTHCFTRLRFILKDKKKANKEIIGNTEGVIQVVEASGQFQVVLGNKVEKVYEAIVPMIGDIQEDDGGDQLGLGTKILNAVAAIFTPTVPAIAASGMLKGFLAIAAIIGTNFYDVDIKQYSTYLILNAASDALFYFMPIILARSAAKVFKTNDYIAMIVGATLCYPAIVELMAGENPVTLFGIEITKVSYTSSVIPIIIAVFILSYVEKYITKFMPDVLKIIMVPTLSLLIMIPATLIVFGPIGIYLGDFVNWIYYYIMNFSPILLGAFIGGIWCVLVIFGAHRAILPIGINDVASTGRQNLLAFAGAANFSQAGAALGVFIKTRNKNLKTVAASATVTALFGITEPAIYGANLRLKKPMIYGVISGALGGALMGWGGSFGNAFANQGILTIPVYADAGTKGFICYILGCAIAFFGACGLTIVLGFKDLPEEKPATKDSLSEDVRFDDVNDQLAFENSDISISSPVEGKVIPLNQVQDEVFASGAMGKGVAIYPSKGEIFAQSDCTVSVLYPTMHAIGLTLDNGVEMLIHIGINTVELNGKFFEKKANVGDHLKQGAPIVTFDINELEKAGYDLTTSVIITNSKQYEAISSILQGTANENKDLLFIQTEGAGI